MRVTKYVYLFITLGLLAVLISFQLYKVFATPIWRDDAYFAIVAKNLILGNGYSAVHFNKLVPFHWGITSGPIIIIPAALMIALFGNTYWAPGLTSILLVVTLLMLAFHQMRRIVPVTCWQSAAFFLLSTMLLSNHEIGFAGENMLIWHALLGEIPSALFVIIATLIIAAHHDNPRTVFIGGIIAGLGALSKSLSLIGSGALGLYLATSYFMAADKTQVPLRQAGKNLLFYGIGVVSPLLLFELVKLVSLGVQGYLATTKSISFFIQNYNSSNRGADAIYNNPDISAYFGLHKLHILGQYFGIFSDQFTGVTSLRIFAVILIVIGLPAVTLYCFFRIRGRLMLVSPSGWAAGALLCCASAHFAWYLLISSLLMPRYITQGIFYACAAMALLTGQITCHNLRKGNIIFALLAILVLYARSDAAEYLVEGIRHNDALVEQRQTLQQLVAIQHREPDTLIFSCGITHEMEYLLPKAANFILCDNIFDPAFVHRKRILLSFTPDPLINTGKVLYMAPGSTGTLPRDNPDNVKRLCPKDDIYAGKYYFMASCQIQ